MVFNLFRMAAIIHGIKGQMLRGNGASADAGAMVAHLDLLARPPAPSLSGKAGSHDLFYIANQQYAAQFLMNQGLILLDYSQKRTDRLPP